MRFTFKSFMLLAACAVALSACGGNGSSSTSQTPTAQDQQLRRSDKTVAADYQNAVESLYIAYFGRPADPTGLANFEAALLAANAPTDIPSLSADYSTNATIQALINSFGTSNESIALYGSGTGTAAATTFVDAVFQNVLGRQPLSSGQTFWVDAITAGTVSPGDAALSIMAGALTNESTQGLADQALIANRLTVAAYFTAQVTSQNAVNAYSGAAAASAARSMLGTVTAATNTTTFETTVISSVSGLLSNVQPIIVDEGPDPANIPAIDEAFTSVTICAPANPTLCQTIDHVLVDTGSYGLRLISSVLTPAMASALSAQTTSSKNTLAECTVFVDGYTWGPIRSVNFTIAGESAQGMSMQIIGDPNFSSLVPDDCSSQGGTSENTVDTFGSNGVIGVGVFQQDCGIGCTSGQQTGWYYTCSSTSCTDTAVSLAQQVPNPVSLFAADNNGVIISLPSINVGADTVSGTMTFGVGTRSNNAIGSASIFPMDDSGNFTTVYDNVSMTDSFIDSGSNGMYFPNQTNIASCSDGFYCPPSQVTISATMQSYNYASNNPTTLVNSQLISFPIANVDIALDNNPNWAAYIPIGADNPPTQEPDGTTIYSFDWGLPFFFGRNVFVVTENKTVNNQTGPFVAF